MDDEDEDEDEDGVSQEQATLLRRALERAGLGLHEVWMHYFSIGGNAGQMEVEAFLHHALPLPPLERDMLAHAVNELIDHRPVVYAPYSSELTDAEGVGHVEARPTGDDEEEEEDGTHQ